MAGALDRLDPWQAAAAGTRTNAAVSAGAGSGKTTVLAARYLELLAEGADIRSILCLTFTRKAAAEMRGRIHRELSASSDPRHQTQLGRFAEAQISTIDSFCSLVLRSSAQDYGYPPGFSIDDERSRAIAEEEALAFVLERREDGAMAELLAHLGFERVWKELFADVAYRLCSPAEAADADFSAMPGRARAAFAAEVARRAQVLLDAAAELRAASEALAAPGAGAAAALAAALATLEAGDGGRGTASDIAQRAAAFEVVNMRAFGRSPEEGAVKAAAGAAREAYRALESAARYEELLPLSEAAVGLLGEFGRRYRAAKRRSGSMGFRDAAVCAVDLLARRKDLRAYWKRRFRYAMIDEFQDDDELQKDLLFLLAERDDISRDGVPGPEDLDPGKLFFVGDEKQSIYRFRGADVSVFRGLAEDLARGSREATLSLSMNYRSEPAIVDFVNEVFGRVFGAAERPYEARFERMRARAATPGTESEILLIRKERSEGALEGLLGDDEALADALADYIERTVGSGAARYDDVAILLRSTSKQYILERFLRLRGIPYSAADPRGLFVESVANDVYSALRLAVLPDDRVAYAAFLRSPLARLSDDGFVRVLARHEKAFDPSSEAALSESDAKRYARGRVTLETLRARADRESIAALVSYLWFDAGLRLSILERPEAHPYLEHYDYLFALARRADEEGACLASFVAGLEPLMGSPEKLDDLSAPREAASGVRIMSIHRSKGLEFPIVILPWIENRGRDDGAGAAWYLSREAGITLNLRPYDEPKARARNIFYEAAKQEDQAMADAEAKRLLYVACTRAISRIVFAAVTPSRNDARGSSFLGLLAGGGGLAGPDGSYAELPRSVRIVEAPPLSLERYGGLLARGPRAAASSREETLSSYAAARPLDRRLRRRAVDVTSIDELFRSEAQAPREGDRLPSCAIDDHAGEVDAKAFGTLCHALIERSLGGAGRGVVDAALRDIPERLRAELEAAAQGMASSFERSALWARLKEDAHPLFERSFLLALDAEEGLIARGRIDLLSVVDSAAGGGRADLVDFKTDARRKEGEHDLQLAIYREAARCLLPGCEVHSWIFWLRSGEAEERSRDFGLEAIAALARRASAAESASETVPASVGEGSYS